MAAYEKTVAYAKSRGLVVIEDAKRNDIGNTAKAYAAQSNLAKVSGGKLLIAAAAAAVLSQPLCMLRQVLLSTFIHDIATKGESAHDAA